MVEQQIRLSISAAHFRYMYLALLMDACGKHCLKIKIVRSLWTLNEVLICGGILPKCNIALRR